MGVSSVRTVVPAVVGTVLAWLVSHGFDVGVDSGQVSAVLVPAVIGVYYTVIRRLEARWPRVGWLLGSPKAPSYR